MNLVLSIIILQDYDFSQSMSSRVLRSQFTFIIFLKTQMALPLSLLCTNDSILTSLSEKTEAIRRKLLYPLVTRFSALLAPVPCTLSSLLLQWISCPPSDVRPTLHLAQWSPSPFSCLRTLFLQCCFFSLVPLIVLCLLDYFPNIKKTLYFILISEQNKQKKKQKIYFLILMFPSS